MWMRFFLLISQFICKIKIMTQNTNIKLKFVFIKELIEAEHLLCSRIGEEIEKLNNLGFPSQ